MPITIPEICSETIACASAGAQALHLHVRDADGRHSLDPGLYRETLDEINQALPGFPVQVTTEAAGRYAVSEQFDCLHNLRPQAASISVREMTRDLELAPRVYALCAELGIHVQHILYDPDDWRRFIAWRTKGLIKTDQHDVLFVLGQYTPAKAACVDDLKVLQPLLSKLPGRFMVCAFGPAEHAVLNAAAMLGADLRLGFENNIHAIDGTLAESNAANIAALNASLSNALETGLAN